MTKRKPLGQLRMMMVKSSSVTCSLHRPVTQEQGTTFQKVTREQSQLEKVITCLGWLAASFGLLPWGAETPKRSRGFIVKTSITILFLVIAATCYFVTECELSDPVCMHIIHAYYTCSNACLILFLFMLFFLLLLLL